MNTDMSSIAMLLPITGSIVGAVVARELTKSATRNVFVDVGIILGLTGAGFLGGLLLSSSFT